MLFIIMNAGSPSSSYIDSLLEPYYYYDPSSIYITSPLPFRLPSNTYFKEP
jgi:hypothetical protein